MNCHSKAALQRKQRVIFFMSENWGLSDRAKQIYKSGNMRQKKIDRYKKNRDSPKIKNGNRSLLGFGTLGPVPIGTEAEAEALGKALFIVVGIRFKFIEAYLIRIEFVGKHIIDRKSTRLNSSHRT